MRKTHPKNLLLLLLTLSLSPSLWATPHFSDDKDPELLAHELVEAMTIEELLGQALMFSWTGVSPSSEINGWISEKNLGGIKLFGWNGYDIETVAKTIKEYQELALENTYGIPLLVATDQEGGIVRHMTDATSLTPGNMSIGASGLPLDSYNSGLLIGQELAAIGINMNFAPDVDLYLEPHTAVIGTRAFSADAEETAFLATLWYKGHGDAGIVSTVKHYPGHGRAVDDSHGVLPILDVTLEDLKKEDLLPYRMLINEGIPAVMVSHLAYSNITGETLPASRSHYFIEELLKDEMDFKGMVITDDMIMYGALMGNMTIEKACEDSLRAGVDMLLVSRGPETHKAVWTRIYKAAESDASLRERIREAAYRVILTKLIWLKGDNHIPYLPQADTVYDQVPLPAMADHTLDLTTRSITLFKDRDDKIPLTLTDESKVLLISQDRYIKEALKLRIPKAHFFDLPSDPELGELTSRLNSLKNIMHKYDTVIITLRNGYDQFIAEGLEEWNDKLIVVISSNPSYVESLPWVDTALFTYLYNYDTSDAVVAVLMGDIEPLGELPAHLDRGDQ